MTPTEHYEKYVNLIRKAAWDRVAKNPNLEFDELVAWGNLAYCEALQTWDPDKGAFSTHLTWQLRHRLGKANQAKIEWDNHTTELDEARAMPATFFGSRNSSTYLIDHPQRLPGPFRVQLLDREPGMD